MLVHEPEEGQGAGPEPVVPGGCLHGGGHPQGQLVGAPGHAQLEELLFGADQVVDHRLGYAGQPGHVVHRCPLVAEPAEEVLGDAGDLGYPDLPRHPSSGPRDRSCAGRRCLGHVFLLAREIS